MIQQIAKSFISDDVLTDSLPGIHSNWKMLLEMPQCELPDCLCTLFQFNEESKAQSIVRSMTEVYLLAPKKKGRKTNPINYKLVIAGANDHIFVVWPCKSAINGPDGYKSIINNIGAVAFSQYDLPLVQPERIPEESAYFKEIFGELEIETGGGDIFPFYGEGNGDYYLCISSNYDDIYFFDHEINEITLIEERGFHNWLVTHISETNT